MATPKMKHFIQTMESLGESTELSLRDTEKFFDFILAAYYVIDKYYKNDKKIGTEERSKFRFDIIYCLLMTDSKLCVDYKEIYDKYEFLIFNHANKLYEQDLKLNY